MPDWEELMADTERRMAVDRPMQLGAAHAGLCGPSEPRSMWSNEALAFLIWCAFFLLAAPLPWLTRPTVIACRGAR